MSCLQSPMYTRRVECITDFCTSSAHFEIKKKHVNANKSTPLSIYFLIAGLENYYQLFCCLNKP